jgi:ABC-type nitrate/sulfonate/bicarbonate transport system ATPase subunit
MLKLDNLSFSYDGNQLFKGLSLEFKEGELTSVVGKSGVGKSTLFSLLSGQLNSDQGSIKLGNDDLTTLPSNKRPTITMFQQESLFPHMTIFENIRFPLVSKYNKARFHDIDHKYYIQQRLKEVNLEGFEDRYPENLSGGQKQRATLARSLAAKPKIMLLDEPFSALNEELKQDLNAELIEIIKKHGIIALKITHDTSEALNFSNKILFLDESLQFHFNNDHLDELIAPAAVIDYFQLGILSDDQLSYFPVSRLKENAMETSMTCKIISQISRGQITEYTLAHNHQRFKYFSDQQFDGQIILYADPNEKIAIA